MIKNILNIKKKCLLENQSLISRKLIILSFGNVSLRLDQNYFCIKPSGVDLNKVKYGDFPIIRISDGKNVNKKLNPSVDTQTHLEIYRYKYLSY